MKRGPIIYVLRWFRRNPRTCDAERLRRRVKYMSAGQINIGLHINNASRPGAMR